MTAAATKKPTNVSVRTDLLQEAKARRINLSATLEAALEAALRDARAAAWQEENRAAMAAYDAHVEREGIFAERVRLF